jgi:hypothetical protein
MVNLEKISDLLEKGVEAPSLKDLKDFFSFEKWKEDVQPYTEPFLSALTETLNEALSQRKDLLNGVKFTISRRHKTKVKQAGSLQDAKLQFPEPYTILARENDYRNIEGFITIGPSSDGADGKYTDAICWGLRWWGTKEKATIVHEIFASLQAGINYKNGIFKDGWFGSAVWLFDAINRIELLRQDFESVSARIFNDFEIFFQVLLRNRELFDQPPRLPLGEKSLEKIDVERAVRRVLSKTRKKKISKTEVFEEIGLLQKKGILLLKANWRTIFEENVDEWFK